MGTDEYNKKAYDQRNIRFPSGTVKRFRELFKDEVSFNGWVVNLVISRLVAAENWFSEHEKK